uniref:Uncharacterized protein n=1 Tax=Ditylenchus dipsaci TaxID=166011 RepID=A0A915EQ26_9BILA
MPFLRQIQNFSAYQKKSDLSPSTLETCVTMLRPSKMCLLMKLRHIALASNENGWCYEVFFRGIKGGNYNQSVVMADGDQASHWANLRKKMKILGIPKEVRRPLYSDTDVLQQAHQ